MTEEGMNWDTERGMAQDVQNNKELYKAMATDPSDDTFDAEAFLDWLDQYDGHVYAHELEQEWSNFPWDGLSGQTCPFRDGDDSRTESSASESASQTHEGEPAYYQHDLRQIAEGRPNYD